MSTYLSRHVEQVGELALLSLGPAQVVEQASVTHVLSDDQDRLLRAHRVQRQQTLVPSEHRVRVRGQNSELSWGQMFMSGVICEEECEEGQE